jgi:hypothetical protein
MNTSPSLFFPQWRQVAMDIIRTENMDNALLVIHSDTGWSAVVEDSELVQESVDRFGNSQTKLSTYFSIPYPSMSIKTSGNTIPGCN